MRTVKVIPMISASDKLIKWANMQVLVICLFLNNLFQLWMYKQTQMTFHKFLAVKMASVFTLMIILIYLLRLKNPKLNHAWWSRLNRIRRSELSLCHQYSLQYMIMTTPIASLSTNIPKNKCKENLFTVHQWCHPLNMKFTKISIHPREARPRMIMTRSEKEELAKWSSTKSQDLWNSVIAMTQVTMNTMTSSWSSKRCDRFCLTSLRTPEVSNILKQYRTISPTIDQSDTILTSSTRSKTSKSIRFTVSLR